MFASFVEELDYKTEVTLCVVVISRNRHAALLALR